MAESRTYVGPSYEGTVSLPDRTVAFTRGVPVEVTADEASLLASDPDWGGTETPAPPVAAPAPTPPAPDTPSDASKATAAGSEVPS